MLKDHYLVVTPIKKQCMGVFLSECTMHIFHKLSSFVLCSYFPYVISKYNCIMAVCVCVCVILLILHIKLMASNETSVDMSLNISLKFSF